MKTPREIVLNRHQSAETRLDQIRRDVVADLRHEKAASCESPFLVAAGLKFWRELILPARRTWAGIAAVWVVIGVINLTQGDRPPTIARSSTATPEGLRMAREQRQELMRELALLPTSEPAEAAKTNLQPRSQRREEFLNA